MGRRASLCLGLVLGARGAGRGPNGLWSVNSKLALVADSNLDGLALVDLQYGGLVERRVFDTEPNSREGAVSVSAVASCDTCAFALAASEEASKLYRVYLPRPLRASLASSEDFGLASATVVRVLLLRLRLLRVPPDARQGRGQLVHLHLHRLAQRRHG